MKGLVASWSLRRRLAAIAFFVCTATLLAGTAAMYRADHVADSKVLDARLSALAQTVLAFAEHEFEENADGLRNAIQGTDDPLGRRYHYQIWSLEGRLLLQSHKAPSRIPMRPLAERGFGEAKVEGVHVRTYAEAAGNGAMVIQIAERVIDRQAAGGTITGYFLSFLAGPLLLIFVSTWWFLNRALRSVDGYASQLRDRDVLDLSDLDAPNPPAELKPMVESINGLFRRFRQALSVEREFTAIAAHEMRTPLAGLRAQAQLATMQAESPKELALSLRGLMSGIDQASYLLDQLLDLARIDNLAVAHGHLVGNVDLERVCRSVMFELGSTAAERDVSIKTRFEVEQLKAVELGLHLLLHNLLVNAIRFTPVGGRIEVAAYQSARGVALAVDDSGPGIPAHRHVEAFQRFNRLGRVDPKGVGLGLSIVQAVAQAHHAAVRLLESPLGGLRVEVLFPLPLPEPAPIDATATATATAAVTRPEVSHI